MPALRAEVSLAGPDAAPLGHARVRLLEAVGREGSISAAARAMGVTYKAAWDGVEAINNLVGRPVVEARTGGKRGGGARLTDDGIRLIEAFHRLEAELAASFTRLEAELLGTGISSASVMWGFFMRTSARNALRGQVAEVVDGAVNAEVTLAITDEIRLSAIITRDSLRELGLFPGRQATALIKAPFVILAPAGEALRTSMGNRLEGVITRVEPGAVNAEVSLEIAAGKTLVSIVTLRSVERLGLAPGVRACALIDASNIILAVN
ncbi:TOBE domain-containing protein [Rhodobacteraceae bacterium DSL-40]|uniref:TOBE domain-containing protein n=1 Tax=Amaricoccus sp. B4 TaxID=3368557 RepID=UPI000DAD60AB